MRKENKPRKNEIKPEDVKAYVRGKKIKLDCGHYFCLHPWSNTLILTADGKTRCHNCY